MQKARKTTFMGWLEGEVSEGMDTWKAAKMMKAGSGDGGVTRMPELEREDGYVSTNKEKSEVFFGEFFRPAQEKSWVPENHEYPPPRWEFEGITDGLVERVFLKMKPNKATRRGTLHNNVMRNTSDILAPYVGPLFRATYNLKIYPGNWSESGTPVIRKPGKPDYRKPGAYRPVNVSNGLGRAANACTKELMMYG
jgi:hypothetical protein